MGLAALDISCVDMIREQFPISGQDDAAVHDRDIVPGIAATANYRHSSAWN